MDVQSLALLLKQTLEPGTRAEAEANLDKVSKIIGFAPGILQVKYQFYNIFLCLVRPLYIQEQSERIWTGFKKLGFN